MKTTLDEWEILQAVVQLGSFASAAEKLNRSQSTISYAMGRLQERLGLQLFELKGRKAMLTETGRALLADAEPLLAGFGKLEHRAGSLVSGGELEIRLSVDSLYTNQRLFAALSEFTRQFPYAHLRLRQATFLSAVTELVTHGADLCITGLITRDYFVQSVLEIRMQAVARSDHPLCAHTRTLSRFDLIGHLKQTSSSPDTGGPAKPL